MLYSSPRDWQHVSFIHFLAPFVMLGIGLDDIFVTLSFFKNTRPFMGHFALDTRLTCALSQAASSMLATYVLFASHICVCCIVHTRVQTYPSPPAPPPRKEKGAGGWGGGGIPWGQRKSELNAYNSQFSGSFCHYGTDILPTIRGCFNIHKRCHMHAGPPPQLSHLRPISSLQFRPCNHLVCFWPP